MSDEVPTVYGHLGWVNCAAFFPDGRRVLTASGGIRIGEEPKDDPTRAEWTGTTAVTGGILREDVDRSLRIWDIHSGQMVRHFAGLTIIVNCLALSPDGLRILVGGRNGDIYLWDTEAGKIVRRFETSMKFVHSLAMSSDGRRALSGSDDKPLRLWDVTTGRRLNSFPGHAEAINGVTFAKDGRRALTGSTDKTMRLWNLETGKEIRAYEGESKRILCVALSPDDRLALSGSSGGSIRLWDLQTAKVIHSLAEQRSRVFLRKTQAFRNKLSASSVNSFRPNFATETKLPSRDTQRKLSENRLLTTIFDRVRKGAKRSDPRSAGSDKEQ